MLLPHASTGVDLHANGAPERSIVANALYGWILGLPVPVVVTTVDESTCCYQAHGYDKPRRHVFYSASISPLGFVRSFRAAIGHVRGTGGGGGSMFLGTNEAGYPTMEILAPRNREP